MKKLYLLVLGLLALVVGITGLAFLEMYPSTFSRTATGRIPRRFFSAPPSTYSLTGESIYFAAVGNDGPIPFEDGPFWLRRHGGSCASCHGSDGQGGLPIMMSSTKAPAITYKSLTQKEEFTDKLIKRAITQGLDEAGKPLDPIMPRWEMSNQDLDDLIDFLKTLD